MSLRNTSRHNRKMTKNRLISTQTAATKFFECDQRTVQRLVKRQRLHSTFCGRVIRLDQAEVEFASSLYHRLGERALPVYPGTYWPVSAVAQMLQVTSQTVRNFVKDGTLAGSASPYRTYITQASLETYRPAVVRAFLGSLGLSWYL